MYGEIAWVDSLSNQYFGGWKIEPTIKGIPRIREITKRESYIHLKLPKEIQKTVPKLPEIEMPVSDFETKLTQQLLFEF